MRIGFTADFLTMERISLIIIAFICYILGIFLLIFSETGALMLLVLFILSGIFIAKPKIMIYLIILDPFFIFLSEYSSLALGGSSYLSLNIGGMLGIVNLIVGISILSFKRVQITKNKMFYAIILFLGAVLLSLIFSTVGVFLYMSRFWIRYAVPVVFYFIIISEIKDSIEAEKFLKSLLISFFIYCIFSYVMGLIVPGKMHVITENVSHDITLTRVPINGLRLIIFSFLTVFFLFSRKIQYKWIYIVSFAVITTLLFFTYTRIGWIAFCVGFFVLGLLRYRKFFLVVLLLIAVVFSVISPLRERALLRLMPDSSSRGRIALAQLGWGIFLKKPILGHGPGSFNVIFGQELDTTVRGKKGKKEYGLRRTLSPHNEYIRFLAEGGIVGIITYLFVVYKGLQLSVNVLKLPPPEAKEIKDYGAFLIAMIIAMLIYGITDQGFELAGSYFFCFIAIGEIYLRELRTPQLSFR